MVAEHEFEWIYISWAMVSIQCQYCVLTENILARWVSSLHPLQSTCPAVGDQFQGKTQLSHLYCSTAESKSQHPHQSRSWNSVCEVGCCSILFRDHCPVTDFRVPSKITHTRWTQSSKKYKKKHFVYLYCEKWYTGKRRKQSGGGHARLFFNRDIFQTCLTDMFLTLIAFCVISSVQLFHDVCAFNNPGTWLLRPLIKLELFIMSWHALVCKIYSYTYL